MFPFLIRHCPRNTSILKIIIKEGKEQHFKNLLDSITCGQIRANATNTAKFLPFLNRKGLISCLAFMYEINDNEVILETSRGSEKFLSSHLNKFNLRKEFDLSQSQDTSIISIAKGGNADQSTYGGNFSGVKLFNDGRLPNFGLRFPINNSILNKYQDHLQSLGLKSAESSAKDYKKLEIEHGLVDVSLCDEYFERFYPFSLHFHRIGSLSTTKGCYIGQEVIRRLSAGNVDNMRKMYVVKFNNNNNLERLSDLGEVLSVQDNLALIVSRKNLAADSQKINNQHEGGYKNSSLNDFTATLPKYCSQR